MSDFPVEPLPGSKVVIETMQGLVSHVHAPEGLEIVVVDHDALGDPELASDDDVREVMAKSPSLPWGSDGYDYRSAMRGPTLEELASTEVRPGLRTRESELAERSFID